VFDTGSFLGMEAASLSLDLSVIAKS
jgi:hypothetical protein